MSPEQEDALYRDYLAMAAKGIRHVNRAALSERHGVSISVVQRVVREHRA